MNSMSIRSRIMLLIIVPVLALGCLSGWIIAERWSTSMRMERVLAASDIMGPATELAAALQVERGRSSLYLGAKGADGQEDLTNQRRFVDAKRALFVSASRAAPVGKFSAELASALSNTQNQINSIDALRIEVSNQAIASKDSLCRYSAIVESLLDLSLLINRDVEESNIKNYSLALSFLMTAAEKASLGRATGAAALGAGAFSMEQLNSLAGFAEEEAEFNKLFKIYAPADLRSAFEAGMKDARITQIDKLRKTLLTFAPGESLSGIAGGAWFKAASARIEFFNDIQKRLLDKIVQETKDADTSAFYQLLAASLAAVCLIAAIVAFGIITIRSISRLISAMTSTMTRLAAGDHHIEIPSLERADEIGSMAQAVAAFKQAAVEKLQLEAEAVAQRHLADAERAARDVEKAEEMRQDCIAIEALGDGLEKLAVGDLMFNIETPFAPKTERLRQDFNKSVHQLRSTIQIIASNTKSVHTGTGEISVAADDLSRRTEQQAASLEETAAALDEITATIRKTAEGATHAKNVVSSAKSEADKGGEVVQLAIEAMNTIEKSSQQITQIIGSGLV